MTKTEQVKSSKPLQNHESCSKYVRICSKNVRKSIFVLNLIRESIFCQNDLRYSEKNMSILRFFLRKKFRRLGLFREFFGNIPDGSSRESNIMMEIRPCDNKIYSFSHQGPSKMDFFLTKIKPAKL